MGEHADDHIDRMAEDGWFSNRRRPKTMSKGFVSDIVNTEKGVVAWPMVFEPDEKVGEDGKKRSVYRLDLIFPGDTDMNPLQDLLYAACRGAYGIDESKWPPFRHKAIRETSEKNPNPQTGQPWQGYEHGKYFISVQSQFKPSIIDMRGRDIIDPAEFYGGCEAILALNAYTYNYKGHGVKLGLVSILKTGNGTPFGAARPDASQIFKKLIKPQVAPPAVAGGGQRRAL